MRADRNYVRLRVGDREHLVRTSLGALERRLAPQRFARVHRSTIVRLDRVRELRTLESGEYRLLMADGTQFEVSRAYRRRLPRAPGDEAG
jgi:two-component system LytT family response regulator